MVGSSVWFMGAGVGCYGDELVAVLSAATAVLKELPARVHRLTGPDLDAVLPVITAWPRSPPPAGTRSPRQPSTAVR